MQLEAIFTVMLAAAGRLQKPLEDVAGMAIRDSYTALKDYLHKKLLGHPEAVDALESATERPESAARKAVLIEESAVADLETDSKLARLVNKLAKAMPASDPKITQKANVSGNHNRIQQALGDIINTEKITKKNKITPDERHISGDQKKKLKKVIDDLAYRLAGEDGKPDYSKVYLMLQGRFDVVSYLLIKREDFENAISFLKQQRAIYRGRLRRKNPEAYEGDFIQKIHACRSHLGWDKPTLYKFALERLPLKKPITSTKQLGVNQLKTLSEMIKREADKIDK